MAADDSDAGSVTAKPALARAMFLLGFVAINVIHPALRGRSHVVFFEPSAGAQLADSSG